MENTLTEKTLDVREMPPRERHPRIFAAFRALKSAETFILVNDHDPKPLLYQFQNEHDGEFEWWPLEQGPEVWRVEIAKRRAPLRNRTITDFFQTDHRRLDALYETFQEALKEDRWEEASKSFREFNLGLRRHIRIEEEILFPAFEAKTGMKDSGPTFVMRMEHGEIRELLDKVLSAADGKDKKRASDDAYSLTNILAEHNMKEEHILYPESDSFLSDPERALVLKKAQAY